jgi:hypothetical protein
MACYNTGPTSFNFSAMYAFISLQGPQNNCGWANVWKRAYQAMQTGFSREKHWIVQKSHGFTCI